jgi:uncharacterized protein YndB with AHSA1/START domain
MRNSEDSITVEQIYDISSDLVWRAITEVDQMRRWFFQNIESFKPEVGFETQFNVRVRNKNFQHQWRLTEVIPKKKLTYNWKYEGYPGDSFVIFELIELNKKTKLKLTHVQTESFPDDIEEFSRESGIAGWNYFIKKSLKDYLEQNS